MGIIIRQIHLSRDVHWHIKTATGNGLFPWFHIRPLAEFTALTRVNYRVCRCFAAYISSFILGLNPDKRSDDPPTESRIATAKQVVFLTHALVCLN